MSQLDPGSPITPAQLRAESARLHATDDQSAAGADRRAGGWGARLARVGLFVVGGVFALLVLAFVAVRVLVWPALDQWRPHLEAWLSGQIDARVQVERLEPGFIGWRPTLVVHGLQVSVTRAAPDVSVRTVHVTLSTRALLAGRLQLDRLDFDSPRLRIEQIESRRWIVGGVLIDLDRPGAVPGTWGWLLNTRAAAVQGLTIDWVDRVGRREHRLESASISIEAGEAGRLQIAIDLPALAAAARGLGLRVDARRSPSANPIEWRNWRGEIHFRADDVELAQLAREWGALTQRPAWAEAIRGGRGPLLLWSEFADGEWRDLLVKTRTESIALTLAGRVLPLRELSLEARARRGLGALVEIEVDQFKATDGAGLTLELADGAQRVVLDSASLAPVELALSAKGFDAGALRAAADRLPLPEGLRRQISPWSTSGRIDSIGIDWRRGDQAPSYTVRLDFDRLSLLRPVARGASPQAAWPSFSNLSGRAEFDHTGGRAWLDSRQVVLNFPRVFAQPAMTLASLSGSLSWTLGGGGLAPLSEAQPFELRVASLKLTNADLSAEIDGRYQSAPKGPGVVDLRGQLSRASVTRVARYLPTTVSASVRDWVARSIVGGQASDTRFVLKGDLGEFPFRDPASGEFLVETRVQGIGLKFARDWPDVQAIDGTLRFERAGMSIIAERARTQGVLLTDVHARIDDFLKPDLAIRGQGTGPASMMLSYLGSTPLRPRIDPFLFDIDLEASARLRLALDIPLAGTRPPRYEGSVNLSEGRFSLAPSLPTITGLTAQVDFADQRFEIRDIAARLLGGPVQADARLGVDGRLRVEAYGRAQAGELERWLLGQRRGVTDGQADFRFELEAARGEIVFDLASELEGISTQLPEPFLKSAGASWPLRVDWRRVRPQGRSPGPIAPVEQLHLRLRDDLVLQTEHRYEAQAARFEFVRGSLSVGGLPLDRLDRGFAITARVPQLDLDAWRAVLVALGPGSGAVDSLAGGDGNMPVTWPGVDRLTLLADTLQAAGRRFRHVDLTGERRPEHWRFRVRAAEIDGYLDWQAPSQSADGGRLIGRFTRLELPATPTSEPSVTLEERPTVRLPALDVEADRLVLGGRELGALRLSAVNTATEGREFWRLDRLELTHPGGRLSASGSWRPPRPSDPESESAPALGTRLDFVLSLTDPGRVLSTFGINGALSGGAGRLSGRVAWRGAPMSIDYPSMSGWLDVELGRGQFLKTEPGIAKLIGVLNLQSLPRRLSLDFRDLIAEGFAFDEIRGAASLAGGVARTDDFRMRGVQALVEIRGEADLAAETQNLRIRVRPEMNAGLASLAYAAMANPAVGLGSFLAQLALRKPLQELFSYEYEVKGSWVDPGVIERARPRLEQAAP